MEYADPPAGTALRPRAGDRLRSAREAQELSLDEVAVRTRVPKRLLDAIEKGEHAALPAPTYSAGFVKVYAQVVGLDPNELARQFRQELGGGAVPRAYPEPFAPADPARVPSRLLAIVALVVAILVAAGYGLWRSGSLSGDGAEDRARLAAGTDALPPAEPARPPAPPSGFTVAPMAAQAEAPAGAGPVVLTAADTVWLRIYERDGKTLFIGEIPAGQRYEVPADAVDPLIRTGRPEALRIRVGDREIPSLGPPSTLVRGVSLGRDALLARAAGLSAATPAPGALAPDAPVAIAPLVPQTGNR